MTTIPKGVTCNEFLQICPALVNVPILTVGLDSNTGTFYYVGMAVYQNTGGGAITTYHDAANHTRQRRRRRRLQYTNTQQQQRQNTKSHIPDFPPASSQSVVASLNRLRQHVAASLHNTSAHHLSNASMYYVGGNTSINSNNNSSSGSDAGDTSSDRVFYVRECGCFPPSQELTHRFCPAVFDTCGIPNDAFSAAHNSNNVPVACFMAQTLHEEILRTAWPILLVWIAIVAGVCCFTDLSMDARHYVARLCCCRRSTDDMVDRILHAPLESRWRRRRQAFLNSYLVEVGLHQPLAVTNIPPPPPPPLPTALELKTKRYKAPLRMVCDLERDNTCGNHEYDNGDDEDDDVHDEAVSCTICFHPLEDGDRIGDLECVHTFHVECLKSWLSRRNTCPLCQAPNVATMRYEAPPQQPASVTDNPENATANAATAPEPIVPTQVSPFINPFSSSVTRQQVIRNMEVRRLTRQAAADAPSAPSTTNVAAPTQQLRRGRDSFRGVAILPQR